MPEESKSQMQQDFRELVEQMRDIAAHSEGFASDDYAKATRRWADEIEELINDD